MELLFKILLFVHVFAGAIGLVTGTLNIIRKKGDKKHKLIGKFFFFSMIINGVFGMIMTIIHPNLFLFIIGIFTVYMVATGQRYLSLKGVSKGQKVLKIDWFLSFTMLFFGIGFIIYSILLFLKSNTFGFVLLTFGLISVLMVLSDFKNYKGKSKDKNVWLLVHIQRMTGAFIAATTAFLVVNNTYLPPVIAWLLPSVLIVPLIFIWSKKHKIAK
ncbi:hypothetical protein [Flavobacterium sp.]|uniref:hypothetical protein n=1 Tax=Flavobacterium sp. TaxID=239 RepID=UPI003750FF6D